MKYAVRSLKYFVKLTFFLAIIIFVMYQLHLVEGSLDTLFVNGKDSLWQIGLMLLVFSAIYPKFGYCTRDLEIAGSDEESLPTLKKLMEDLDYEIYKETDGKIIFRKRNVAARLSRFYEDKVTVSRNIKGYSAEGMSKDIIRIVNHCTTYSTRDQE